MYQWRYQANCVLNTSLNHIDPSLLKKIHHLTQKTHNVDYVKSLLILELSELLEFIPSPLLNIKDGYGIKVVDLKRSALTI